jgi:hypothetical protein
VSYVIQNFNDINKKITLTPRFKFFFFLKNLNKFLIFFKFNSFLNSFSKINSLQINYFNVFFKYLFSKQFIKFSYQFNLTYVGNYTNNLTKSYIFYFFFNLNNFFKLNFYFLSAKHNYSDKFLFNMYYFSIKTLNIKIPMLFYKNIFFYYMLINPFIWYQHTSNLKFYLNFIFVNYNLKISRFYNNHFLKVYNY